MKHSHLKGYKTIFYIAIIFAVVLLCIWRFGIQRIDFIANPLTKELSGYLLGMLGLTFILFSVCMKFLIKKDNGLFYLGILSLMLGSWIYLRSGTVHVREEQLVLIECLKATLLALVPFAVVLYFNEFQNQRYVRVYQPIMIVSGMDWVVTVIVLNAMYSARTTLYMAIQMVVVITLALCIYTMIVDAVKRMNRYSIYVSIGLLVCAISSAVEIWYVYHEQMKWIDETYGYGLLFAFLAIGLLTIYKQIQEQKLYERSLVEEERNFMVKKLNAEIQKPIQKIIQFSEQMMDECQDEETFQTAGEIRYESDNIFKLVENVLACVKLENGTFSIQRQNIDSAKAMNEIINGCFQQIERKGLELVVNIAEDFPKAVYGDYDGIQKICNILLDNAIRYTEEGTITFSIGWLPVEKEEIKVFITIEDTGKGFEEGHLQKIKDIFCTPELTQNRIYLEGVGYGLIAAVGLAREMEATLRVESERNQGTTMSVTLSQNVIDSAPIGEFQNWYDVKEKVSRRLKKKEEIRNELKEEIRQELEKANRQTRKDLSTPVMKNDRDDDNYNKMQFQNAVLQLEKESVHIRNAMKYVADDFEQYICLMHLFVQTAEEKQEALKELLQQKNYRDYTVKTHALKNNARTLGADELADIAFAHEKASDKEDIEYVKSHIQILLEEWERVKNVFLNYLSSLEEGANREQKEETTSDGLSDISEDGVREQLKKMITYLDTFKKKEALETAKELLQYDLKEETRSGILEAQETIQKYDYAKALATLERLLGREVEL